jgi:hypothetical protein
MITYLYFSLVYSLNELTMLNMSQYYYYFKDNKIQLDANGQRFI